MAVLLLLGDDGSFLCTDNLTLKMQRLSLCSLWFTLDFYIYLSLSAWTHTFSTHASTHRHTRPKIHTLAYVHVCVCVNYPAAVTQRLMISHHCEVGLKFESLD